MSTGLTRREFAAFAGASVLARPAFAQTDALLTRAVPGSGERVPVVGLGTASVLTNSLGEPLFAVTNMVSTFTNDFERSEVGW